jgi:pimeloyl-ACP methyl ester carboxylesterase
MAWHYVDLFEQLGLEQVPVIGFSLGAWIAVETALLRPQLIRKLVMVNAAGLHVDGAPIAELFIDDLDDLRRLLFFDPDSAIVEQAMPLSFDDPRILMHLRAREASARVGWNPYMHDPKLPRHLHRIACPTLVLWGRDDELVPLAHGEYYAQHLPNARLQVLDHCGHMLPFEKPSEFVQRATEFLTSQR